MLLKRRKGGNTCTNIQSRHSRFVEDRKSFFRAPRDDSDASATTRKQKLVNPTAHCARLSSAVTGTKWRWNLRSLCLSLSRHFAILLALAPTLPLCIRDVRIVSTVHYSSLARSRTLDMYTRSMYYGHASVCTYTYLTVAALESAYNLACYLRFVIFKMRLFFEVSSAT